MLSAARASLLAPRRGPSLLGEPAAITGLQFNATSRVVAVATAANGLSAYDVDSGLPTPWSSQQAEAVAAMLEGLPGSITGLSFSPDSAAPYSLMVHSAGGLCHISMDAPITPPGQREVYGGGASGKQRRKHRKQQGRGSQAAATAAAEVGRNGRLLQLQHCCLLAGHLSTGQALLVEKPWGEVLAGLMPPLYRHRYGT